MKLSEKDNKLLDKMLEPIISAPFGVFTKGYSGFTRKVYTIFKRVRLHQERNRIKRKHRHSR